MNCLRMRGTRACSPGHRVGASVDVLLNLLFPFHSTQTILCVVLLWVVLYHTACVDTLDSDSLILLTKHSRHFESPSSLLSVSQLCLV